MSRSGKVVAGLFFIAYLCVGLLVFRDYGFSCDEAMQRELGRRVYNFVFEKNKALYSAVNIYHGPLFQFVLYALEKTLNLQDTREIYLMRHLATFLLFYAAVFFFYLLCARHFKDWRLGLLGALFLIVSPRIFANSFYDPKDIPFLSLFIINIYILLRFLDKKSLIRALVLALASAALISVRVGGVLLPVFTVFFASLDFVAKREAPKKAAYTISAYLLSLFLSTWLFWPSLWGDPVNRFVTAIRIFADYPLYVEGNLYMGEQIRSFFVPWHYTPVWIAITTPVSFTVLFCAGVLCRVWSWLKKRKPYLAVRDEWVFALWFSVPMAIVMITTPNLYNGWRHLFFIYPAFLIFAVSGWAALFDGIRACAPQARGRLYRAAIWFLVIFDLAGVGRFMLANHPYENVYFNPLVGGVRGARFKYDLDYWGLSYTKALEVILKRDPDPVVKVYNDPPGGCGAGVVDMLSPDLRKRVVLLWDLNSGEAEYFLGHYWLKREEYPFNDEFYSIRVDGVPILSVYRLP
jgi:hypothetical protein